MSPLIITRHAGIVEWLRRRGVVGEVVPHATAALVADRDVIGILPLNLCALARSITTIDLPELRPEQRGAELTPAEMDGAGAHLQQYVVVVKRPALS